MKDDASSLYDSFAEQAALGLFTLRKNAAGYEDIRLSDLAGLSTEQRIEILRAVYSGREDDD